MDQNWNENDERLSRLYVFKMWRFTVSRFFENKSKVGLKNYWLCPSHYLNTSALNWYAMHNMKNV